MAPVDPQLKDIGKQRGLEIWQIKKLALEKLPKEQFGNFYIGDSYIILYTKSVGDWNVHFWLGSETTVDEQAAAAIKSIEIDEALNGMPVQYREVQGYESSLFLSYFKDGIRYLKGGTGSGFTHVIDKYENWKPRLFQCKGKRNVRCIQVECKRESLNLGDVFVLDCGLKLYVWMPPESGRLERIKAMDQARNIRDQERSGKPKIIILDTDWDTDDEFWKVLGGKGSVKSAEAGGSDENYWQTTNKQLALWRVSDESGEISVKLVSQGEFHSKQLESKDAFILDAYNGGIYVWIGKKCSSSERKKAMAYAMKYMELQKRPKFTQVIRVLEDAEPAAFIQWASTWEGSKKAPQFTPKLYQCSDRDGKLTIEEIYDYTQKDLDGDDVMIVDALNVIYVWVGAGATALEKKLADVAARKYLEGDTLPRPPGAQIVKMEQGKETPSFKKIFDNWDDNISDVRTVENVKKELELGCGYLSAVCD